jgi:hypothetical protein
MESWYHNVDKSLKHYAKWKKPDIKDHDCMIPFLWNIQKGKPIETESKLMASKGGRGWEWEMTLKGTVSFCGDKTILELGRDAGCTTLWIY